MRNPFLLLERIDPTAALCELDAHPELWDRNGLRKNNSGGVHSGMSDIWMRYNDEAPFIEAGSYAGFNDKHVPIWYPAADALPILKKFCIDLMGKCRGEMLGGVLITRIPPGHEIKPHIDTGWHVNHFSKLYWSLRSNPQAVFGCGEHKIAPDAGDLYLFDNRDEHWVKNDGETDRITLIVCMRTDIFKDLEAPR